MFGLFKRKDPICGMKEEKGRGVTNSKTGYWFCSESCLKKYEEKKKSVKNTGCCRG